MSDFTYQEGTALTWAQMNENLRLMQAKYLDSANNAAIAIAAANFKGNWSALTGALAVPASVYHSSKFWLLLSNLADVTAKVPGVDAEWLEIITGNVMGPASGTAGNVAVLDATGKVLSDGGVAPAALMPKAGGTFTGAVSVPAAATGAQAPQVQEVVKKSGDSMTGALSVAANLTVTSASGLLGYGTGAGGTVTQATSKSTAVTLNKPAGRITTNNAALGAGASAVFAVNNSFVSANDIALVTAAGFGSYRIESYISSPGVFAIRLTNISAGSRSEAIVINFAIIKGATS